MFAQVSEGHYGKSKDELLSDVLLWTATHGRSSICRPSKYLQTSTLCRYWISSIRPTRSEG